MIKMNYVLAQQVKKRHTKMAQFLTKQDVFNHIENCKQETKEYWKVTDDDNYDYEKFEGVYFNGNYYTALSKIVPFWKKKEGYNILSTDYLGFYPWVPNSESPGGATEQPEFSTKESAIEAFIKESISRNRITFVKCDLKIL